MKNSIKKIKLNHISLSNVYVISIVVMMIFTVFLKKEVFLQTSLFSRDTLHEIQTQLQVSSPQYLFLISRRVGIILSIFILSTTSVGDMYVYFQVIRLGLCTGLFFSIVILRYGLIGILLLVAGMFPHYLVYIPALILTLHLAREKRKVSGKLLIQLLVIICVVIIGCLLESYVNPNIVSKMLKNF